MHIGEPSNDSIMYTIGMCVDDAYLVPALVALVSAAGAIPICDRRDVPVRVLTSNLSRAQAETMASVTRWLGFHSFDARWEDPHPSHRIVHGPYISQTTYLRFSFDAFFVERPYLVYCDADILVLDDISPPLNFLTHLEIGLVRDLINHTISRGPQLPGAVERWPDLDGRPYYNAGMMWCSTLVLGELRRGVTELLTHRKEHIFFNDQDALNLWGVRSSNIRPVHSIYNSFEMERFREVGDDWVYAMAESAAKVEPAVVHYVGPEKPWQSTCPNTAGTRLYCGYLREALRCIRRVGDRSIEVYASRV
jgi:lipopolysaccharide biosynthesis glycosyltransferase